MTVGVLTGMEEELNPLPCNTINYRVDLNWNSKSLTIPVTIRPTYNCARVVELVKIAFECMSLRYEGRTRKEHTVPTSMVDAPAMIMRFRPIDSPKKKTIRLPTAHPMS